ncbi:hypothetical protein M8Z33_38470 [Streptomyces sp. ZAF1911]|uniref:hypothetical protein n=1 Tax=unclassified Streptomyces TaxID=2593676 RepID=UPI00202EF7F4|nr:MULTISPECIES: hypothetical protein [unclassified Streptomyces]MCM1967511.1 hypothetical protein [Streptomyces sp. G1]MCX5126067.1 hypothetical protein [Streptomyces sp. NBC_00347]MCX5298134.1 hypothetical protein [Streptomyces sp. NBC_00193]MDD9382431.1 hypothetical protein [Streptomyces sp. ZAF1911]
MTYDRLVCANCAGPVSQGRCRVCRANRERLQQEGPFSGGINPVALIALLVILVAALALVAQQTA